MSSGERTSDFMENIEKQLLIIELIDDLMQLSDKAYQEAKDYWNKKFIGSEDLNNFVQKLFAYTDKGRKAVQS